MKISYEQFTITARPRKEGEPVQVRPLYHGVRAGAPRDEITTESWEPHTVPLGTFIRNVITERSAHEPDCLSELGSRVKELEDLVSILLVVLVANDTVNLQTLTHILPNIDTCRRNLTLIPTA